MITTRKVWAATRKRVILSRYVANATFHLWQCRLQFRSNICLSLATCVVCQITGLLSVARPARSISRHLANNVLTHSVRFVLILSSFDISAVPSIWTGRKMYDVIIGEHYESRQKVIRHLEILYTKYLTIPVYALVCMYIEKIL